MYYPKSQIKENLYTNGGEYMVEATKQPYKGYYYQISNNKRYTGKNTQDKPNNLLVPLRPDVNYGDDADQNTTTSTSWAASYKFLQRTMGKELTQAAQPPKQSVPQPTKEDYTNGFFNRYFLYNITNKSTIETNKANYTQFVNESPSVQFRKYTPIQITWGLVGKREEIYKANSNNVELIEKNLQVYGFQNYFHKKYDQYFQYGQNENLYSDGSELVYTKSKKPYIGYYHIHPEKGPMAGRQHKVEPHDYLEFIPTGSTLNPLPVSEQSGSYVENPRTSFRTGGGY